MPAPAALPCTAPTTGASPRTRLVIAEWSGARISAQVGGEVVTTGEALEVAAAAEHLAGPRQQHDPGPRIGSDRERGGQQVLRQRQVDPVGGVGPVQREVGDAVAHVEVDGLVGSHAAKTTAEATTGSEARAGEKRERLTCPTGTAHPPGGASGRVYSVLLGSGGRGDRRPGVSLAEGRGVPVRWGSRLVLVENLRPAGARRAPGLRQVSVKPRQPGGGSAADRGQHVELGRPARGPGRGQHAEERGQDHDEQELRRRDARTCRCPRRSAPSPSPTRTPRR